MAECPRLKVVSVRQNKITGSREPQAIAEQILAHSNVDILNLDGNAITKLQLEAMNGISQFMERRKELKDKGILAGISADMSLCGLDWAIKNLIIHVYTQPYKALGYLNATSACPSGASLEFGSFLTERELGYFSFESLRLHYLCCC